MEINHMQRYLALNPWTALITMINDQFHFQLDPHSTILVEEEPLDNGRLEVTIATNRSQSLRNLLPPLTQHTFILTRLDIGRYFNDMVIIQNHQLINRNTTAITHWLRTYRDPVVFDINDVIHEDLPEERPVSYRLKAHPRSLRWVGELTVNLI